MAQAFQLVPYIWVAFLDPSLDSTLSFAGQRAIEPVTETTKSISTSQRQTLTGVNLHIEV